MTQFKAMLALALVGACASSVHAFTDGHRFVSQSQAFSRWEFGVSMKAGTNPQDDVEALTFMGYAVAVYETQIALKQACQPGVVSNGQIASSVAKFVRDNPESWSKQGLVIASEAIRKSFPCENK